MSRCIGQYVWRRLDGLSLEHARVEADDDGHLLHGALIAVEDGQPLQLDYRVRTDRAWITREVELDMRRTGVVRRLTLTHDGHGRWCIDGGPAAHLDGCSDVDLELSPITNTPPIRRDGGEVRVAWVRFPSLAVQAARQRYLALGARRWRFESAASGFTAELDTDHDGVVVAYEGLFERVPILPQRAD